MNAGDKPSRTASSNWLALRQKLPETKVRGSSVSAFASRKRRKLSYPSDSPTPSTLQPSTEAQRTVNAEHEYPRGNTSHISLEAAVGVEVKNGESVVDLRRMVQGEIEHSLSHQQPGKYLAVDCEMVGVGIEGAESVLARVSLVNFYGHVLLDVIVRPRERVVDYRTEFSGIRPSDMVHARPFDEVQKQVADLLNDRILVGHAVHNDLKALLLSHPRPHTRDTQLLAHKHKVSRGRRPALRHLVQQELGLTIQGGEHSSVTDARATMALFRLHRKTWEKGTRSLPTPSVKPIDAASASSESRKRPHRDGSASEDSGEEGESGGVDVDAKPSRRRSGAKGKGDEKKDTFPGGGRRGVSSGLSTIIKRAGGAGKSGDSQERSKGKTKTKEKWWTELGGGSKGSVRLRAG